MTLTHTDKPLWVENAKFCLYNSESALTSRGWTREQAVKKFCFFDSSVDDVEPLETYYGLHHVWYLYPNGVVLEGAVQDGPFCIFRTQSAYPEKEFFRGVIWPRQTAQVKPMQGPEGPVYRYAIVGMLVTDKPLSFDGINEIGVNGSCHGLSDVIQSVQQDTPKFNPGDATNWLTSLDNVFDTPE